MVCLRFLWLCSFLAIIWSKQAAAQDSFGDILLQAFTTGMAPAGNLGPTPAPMTSVLPPQEVLPEETLAPGSSPDVEDELSLETAEASMEFEIDTPEPKSPSPSIEVSFEDEEEMIVASSSPFPELSPEDLANESFEPVLGKSPEASPEESPEESPEQSFEESPSPAANVPVDDDEDFSPIQVNCGSFDERSAFREETDKWFNIDSLTAEDPYALSRFSSLSEGVLYATYRYAEENVTYSVPLPTSGLFELSLHWAEISPLFMQDGARVFEVGCLSGFDCC